MQIQLIRSATLRVRIADQTFLIDPWLAGKGQGNSYSGKAKSPLVDLPMSGGSILNGVDGVIVSHLHSDHWDEAARSAIDVGMPILCHEIFADDIRAQGFHDVRQVTENTTFNGVSIDVTDGRHGPPKILGEMGPVSGFVFRAPDEPVLYWAGDTILCDDVRGVILQHSPDVIVVHACGATWDGIEPLVMDVTMTLETVRISGAAKVIATHLDAVDHATVTRSDLTNARSTDRAAVERLLIPKDGESLNFSM